MLLSELLDAPELGLRLLFTTPDALDRPIGRVVTTDLLEPGNYLSGGELVLTGLVWRRSDGDSEVFVASMAGRGATTILAGKALFGSVPDDLLEACRRHEVTLVEVPTEVAFADVAEHVAAASSAETGARLSASLVRQRQLLSAIASGRSLDELAARISTEIGHDCRVITATGRHVVPGPGPLDDETLDAVTRRFLTADRTPAVADAGGASYSLFPVGSGLGNRLTAWALVIEGDHTKWSGDHVEAVHELCAIAALDRARRDEGRLALRPLVADALAMVESGAPYAEVATRLRQAGAQSDRPMVVAIAELRDDGSADVAMSIFEDVALTVGPAIVAPGRDGLLVGLLPSSPELPDLLRRAFARLAPGLVRARLAVGVSGETVIDALAGALEEARSAHRVARVGGTPVSVVTSDEVASHVLLLATVPDDVRRTYTNRVLGPVLEHDRRTHTELIATLREFLACSGSWSRTAESLHLHVNTVRYRIERVEQLTGRDLSSLEDRVDVFLALKSL
ncbi:DNA-binding PucR family transcriptional regulator [Kribbella sp. VKM Ac-2527]|uniref:DNA-binding PucR family transcriptional regulator n=1 Tax=Kribbella caucasensis TaxID=2512215 RepID=A0A4V6PT62_9ACTN|nr:PucR family transcriptional regulator [Kribbella sp. VKM Ac-2527]TDO50608.1 DNA-binding PucR family transcriptional regulator [Kribbella sp. VKM Ac-2527]